MRESRDPINQLRNAIDCLPVETRRAMLEGIRTNPIIVGAYTDSRGGICPMLAAHRQGARHDHLPFARSWDALSRSRRVRRATRRELGILEDLLVASLDHADPDVDLGAAIREHQEARRRRIEIEAGRKWRDGREFGEIKAARLTRRDAENALARLEVLADRF